jgi:C1A family cysteine protease
VYDQLDIGSCTANAIAGAIEFDEKKQKLPNTFTPSRLFIYYNERVIEHSVSEDAGASLRDGIKSVGKQGYCSEKEWPYGPARAGTWKDKPTPECYKNAKKHKAIDYFRVQ